MAEIAERYPPLGRMSVYVDGENIVYRYQALLDSGRTPDSRVSHEQDVFAWIPHAVRCEGNVVTRAKYYTYCTGATERVAEVRRRIKELRFRQYSVPGKHLGPMVDTLTPVVFWKSSQQMHGKGVDIQLTVDVLSDVYKDNVDVVYLVSGDGDYKPLIQEVQRQGKQVYLAAFANGLSSELPLLADKFTELENLFLSESR